MTWQALLTTPSAFGVHPSTEGNFHAHAIPIPLRGGVARSAGVVTAPPRQFGSFEFSETGAMVDLEAMAALYEQVEYWQQATVKEDLVSCHIHSDAQ